MHAHKQQLYL